MKRIFSAAAILILVLFFLLKLKPDNSLKKDFRSFVLGGVATERLQIAEIKKIEIIDKTSKKVLWDMVKLPDVVVRFQTPVTYTYYIDFKETWDIRKQGNLLIMKLPALKMNEPASDISQMEFFVKEGSLLRGNQEAIDSVKPELNHLLKKSGEESLPQAYELAQNAIVAMAQRWKEMGFVDFEEIKIEFLKQNSLP